MKKRYQYKIFRMPVKTLITVIILLCGFSLSSQAQVVVIAHPSVPIDKIEQADLYDIYSGETRLWHNDETVITFDLRPKTTTKVSFYNFLGKSPSRMKSIWMVNMLSGEGDPPVSVDSEEEMLQKVANTPGAIGFLSKAKADTLVKIIRVIE